jgi:hypothetical protein
LEMNCEVLLNMLFSIVIKKLKSQCMALQKA